MRCRKDPWLYTLFTIMKIGVGWSSGEIWLSKIGEAASIATSSGGTVVFAKSLVPMLVNLRTSIVWDVLRSLI